MRQNRGSMRHRAKKWLLFALRWGVAVAGIWWVISNMTLRDRVTILDDHNRPISAMLTEGKYVAALSSDARLLLFPLDELPERPNGGVGVQLIALPENISLADVALTDGKSLVVSGIKRKNRAAETLDAKQLAEHVGKRAQRGKLADVGFRPDRLDDSVR